MRKSGILLPIFSLPSEYGIGDLYQEAFRFVDWLVEAGQHYWQVLPIGPVNQELCPYQSSSSFAGEPLLISLDKLVEKGLLDGEHAKAVAAAELPQEEQIFRSRFAGSGQNCRRMKMRNCTIKPFARWKKAGLMTSPCSKPCPIILTGETGRPGTNRSRRGSQARWHPGP